MVQQLEAIAALAEDWAPALRTHQGFTAAVTVALGDGTIRSLSRLLYKCGPHSLRQTHNTQIKIIHIYKIYAYRGHVLLFCSYTLIFIIPWRFYEVNHIDCHLCY